MGACLLGSAPMGGADDGVLRMTVSTNSVVRPGVRVRSGQQLVRVYRLRNYAEFGLQDIVVRDAQTAAGLARCPRHSVAPLGTMTCRATLVALPGRHLVRVTAAGSPAWEGYHGARASAPAGYHARTSVLVLERSASQKRLSYRLAYTGPARLDHVALHDPLLGAAPALHCSGGAGLPRSLPPGGSTECWAAAPAGPGRHESVARASGTTADLAVSSTGRLLPPLVLTAQAAAGYTVPAPPRVTSPPAVTGPPDPRGSGRPQPSGAPRPTGAPRPPGAPTPPGAPRPSGAPPAGTPPRDGTPPVGVPPGDAPAAPPGDAAGDAAGGDPAAGTPQGPVALTAPGRQFLVAAPPQGQVPGGRPAVRPDARASAAPRPPGTAVSGHRAVPRRASLLERGDWALLTLMLVLFPALLAAMGLESRRSKNHESKD